MIVRRTSSCTARAWVEARKRGVDLGEDRRGQRLLLKVGKRDQPGAQSVFDVMAVVGDVVGDRCDLRLEPGEKVEFQVLALLEGADRVRKLTAGINPGGATDGIEDRAVVLHQPFVCLEAEIQPVEERIAALKFAHDTQALGIVVEPLVGRERFIERAFAGVAERRMTEIVGERQGLREVFVEPERAGNRAGDLRDLQGVDEPRAEVVVPVLDEDLRLVLQAAEGVGMDDTVAIALVGRAERVFRLGVDAAARRRRVGGIGGAAALAMAKKLARQLDHPASLASEAPKSTRKRRLARLTTGPGVLSYNSNRGKSGRPMDQPTVTLSDSAVRRIAKILAVEPAGTALRVSVEGGGCSGFQYRYDLVQDSPAADDILLSRDGAKVLIDAVSLDYMGGSEIDFVDDLIGQSFQIKNPHAVASCGCGTSFSV